jgi:hypothetical protein
MMSRVNCRSGGAQSVDMYRTAFPALGYPYHSARCEMDSRDDTVFAGENFIRCFIMALSVMFWVIPMNLEL